MPAQAPGSTPPLDPAGEEYPQAAELRRLTRARGYATAQVLEREPPWARHFTDLSFEWRRLFSELFGTFLLVTVGAGGAVLQMITHGGVGRVAAVTAPGLLVTAVILFMGAVSGAHLNPVVSLAFALRRDFQWRRVPAYIAAQLAGAAAACALLQGVFGGGVPGGHLDFGASHPGAGFTAAQALVVETVLTLGLVSTILGTASTAQNIGPLSAFGVGAYIVLAGLWAGPVSGASMNPARSIGPALISDNYRDLWIFVAGPLAGALLAVGAAFILRGPGGGRSGTKAAQGTLGADPHQPS